MIPFPKYQQFYLCPMGVKCGKGHIEGYQMDKPHQLQKIPEMKLVEGWDGISEKCQSFCPAHAHP